MTGRKLLYRGVSYDTSSHIHPGKTAVYRSQHYSAPLRHEPAVVNEAVGLPCRGLQYKHHPQPSHKTNSPTPAA